ncbi:MAG: hypothetical protein RDV48_27980 [Candidatus Eremiobacteraeota bacterium]|nr:hypothetical protein [Candidatus Eremiobacteraeota bacterium]
MYGELTKTRRIWKGAIAMAAVLFFLLACSPVYAGSSATQVVMLKVTPVDDITMEGGSSFVSLAQAASARSASGQVSSSYSSSSVGLERRITGAIDEAPSSQMVKIHMAAPEGARSSGYVPLSQVHRSLVTGTPDRVATDLPITYRMSSQDKNSTPAARTITFTITGD